jgi:hypothetical protein
MNKRTAACSMQPCLHEFLSEGFKASLNGEFHRPGFQDVKLWYEIDVSLNA